MTLNIDAQTGALSVTAPTSSARPGDMQLMQTPSKDVTGEGQGEFVFAVGRSLDGKD